MENSPWAKFQELMMEHARENNQLGQGLSDKDFEQLKLMHQMTPQEREVCHVVSCILTHVHPSNDRHS